MGAPAGALVTARTAVVQLSGSLVRDITQMAPGERAMPFVDKTLHCLDCGKEFVFTAQEQDLYARKGLTDEPVRCENCRDARGPAGVDRRQSLS